LNDLRRLAAWSRIVAVLLLACSAPPASAATPELRPFKASYSITYRGVSAGSAEVELQSLADGRWSYQQRSQPRLIFRPFVSAEPERSIFSVQGGHILPQKYSAGDEAQSGDDATELNFDWVRGRVTGVAERKHVDLPTQAGLLDTMSVHVALMHELLAGNPPQRFVLVDEDEIKEYNFTAEGTATLRTAVGEHRTVIFRSNRPGSRKSMWYWCAPDLGFLPLKVEKREGKEVVFSMAVKSLTIGEAAD
jgi:hypothetical protein